MSTPDFMIIGAMKCGTSTLAAQLGAQTGLFMTDPKEPNYFSDDDVYAKGPAWYAGLFAGAAPGDLRGEASTHYTKRPTYPHTLERLQATAPAPRLVYMIRNPMVRLVSHYIHAWSEGETAAALEEAIGTIPELVNYGLYGWQIAPFAEAFGRDALLLTSLERLKAHPEAELARIAAHLGHSGAVSWKTDLGAQNVSSQRVRKLPFHNLIVDSAVATTLRRTLVPKALRQKIRQARQMHERPEIPAEMRASLENRFLDDRADLAAIFPDDPSLTFAFPFAP